MKMHKLLECPEEKILESEEACHIVCDEDGDLAFCGVIVKWMEWAPVLHPTTCAACAQIEQLEDLLF